MTVYYENVPYNNKSNVTNKTQEFFEPGIVLELYLRLFIKIWYCARIVTESRIWVRYNRNFKRLFTFFHTDINKDFGKKNTNNFFFN
jgi:hypothetical protein